MVPRIGPIDAGEDLQQRALAGAVTADDPEELALVNVEGDAAKRAQLAVVLRPERMDGALLERVDPLLGIRNILWMSRASMRPAHRRPKARRRRRRRDGQALLPAFPPATAAAASVRSCPGRMEECSHPARIGAVFATASGPDGPPPGDPPRELRLRAERLAVAASRRNGRAASHTKASGERSAARKRSSARRFESVRSRRIASAGFAPGRRGACSRRSRRRAKRAAARGDRGEARARARARGARPRPGRGSRRDAARSRRAAGRRRRRRRAASATSASQ